MIHTTGCDAETVWNREHIRYLQIDVLEKVVDRGPTAPPPVELYDPGS